MDIDIQVTLLLKLSKFIIRADSEPEIGPESEGTNLNHLIAILVFTGYRRRIGGDSAQDCCRIDH